MTTQLFGAPIKRKEDPRLVTGGGRYLDDLGHDAWEAAFVRSPHAHARIVDIDVTDALDVPGLVGIWTHEDLAGPVGDHLPVLIPHPALTNPVTGHALAKDEVNHVGEAIVLVIAHDRYAAEDAVARVRVDYEFLTPVVGLDNARAATHLVHEEAPGNVSANLRQEVGDVDAAMAAAPNRLTLDLSIERSACMPMEGKGVYARWNSDDQHLTLYSSTQTSTGVRAAVAARLGMPLAKVDCIAPDVGGGFGVKIMHPWPEEVLVPWAARMLDHDVKWTEDRREHFISSAHERGQLQEVEVGFDDEGRVLALDVRFWHDNGAYTPYGIIVPIITATQLLGPYKPGTYRVEFWSMYTNTVLVTPYRGAGRPQGCFAMERTMDAIAEHLGIDRAEVRSRNFILPAEMPYDHGLMFQDGRPLKYDSGDFPASLAKLKALVGWDDFAAYRAEAEAQGRRVGLGIGCYVEGTGVGPYEGGHIVIETSGRVNVATGLTTQGQGHQTAFAQIVADELGVPIDDVHVTTGDTRRMPYAVGTFASRAAVMSGNAVALAARQVRAKALRIAADALEVSAEDLEIVDGDRPGQGRARHVDGPRDRRRPVQPAALRIRRRGQGGHPVRRHLRPGQAPRRGRRGAGSGGQGLLLPDPGDLRQRHARGDRRDRPGHRGDQDPALLRRPRLRDDDQPDDRRGPGARRRRAGRRRRALRADGLRRVRAAPQRELHGLPHAVLLRGPAHRDRPPRDAVAAQPPRHQGRRRGRVHPGLGRHRLGDRGRRGLPDPVDADQPRRALGAPSAARPRSPGGAVMKISGNATLTAPVDQVWNAFMDPAVLARTLPGCESLTETGPDAYAMRVTAGVAAVKGTYDGTVAISDKAEPGSFTMKAQGAGGPGTIAADVAVRLAPSAGGGTDLAYDADAVVGGVIGGVGQRMLTGVTKKMAGEFFTAVDRDIATGGASAAAPPAPVGAGPGAVAETAPGQPRVYAGSAAAAPGGAGRLGDQGFALGVAVGGLVALAGVALGAAIRGLRN